MQQWCRKIKKKIRKLVNDALRYRINRLNRKKLNNRQMTLIASNCNGCLMLHDLDVRYNSPFVNLFITAEDYIRLLQNFECYMSMELQFPIKCETHYPIGYIGDVEIHFVHYRDTEEAQKKWNERKKRMDMSNSFVMFTDRDGCTVEHLQAFDKLPFTNKVVFTHDLYPEIKSSCYIAGFEDGDCVGNLHQYRAWNGMRYYDTFDYVAWFNGNVDRKE